MGLMEEAVAPTYWRASATTAYTAQTYYAPPYSRNLHLAVSDVTPNDSTYISISGSSAGYGEIQLSGATVTTVNGGLLRVRAKYLSGSAPYTLVAQIGATVLASKTLTATYQDFEYVLTKAEAAALSQADLRLRFTKSNGGAPIAVSWCEFVFNP